ncbi:hypothetical protein HYN48_07380 [Flavobacterium magnum]|uniref:Response regulatory domain-containing protein n=1 Tax=Flavobacterium magnum TaxID=2162713 RepID=A0A2S0RE69_9FLAO|nr:response regulator [Flavobacterium magnum]AWA29915.1 hypothetical protein HYN48_07380 [Flavobacterium magnum]
MNMTPTTAIHRVMIVDDSDIDRYIAKKIMARHDFCNEVIDYEKPAEALEFLNDNQQHAGALPDVIFLDVYMPEINGFDFMKVYDGFSAMLKAQCDVYIVSSTIDPKDLMMADQDPNIVALHVKPLDAEFLSRVRQRRP